MRYIYGHFIEFRGAKLQKIVGLFEKSSKKDYFCREKEKMMVITPSNPLIRRVIISKV
jgi:hypothetical protein